MAGPPIVILGYAEAAMYLRTEPVPNVAAIISIHGQREFGVESDIAPRLDLGFDDIEPVDPANATAVWLAATRQRRAAENGLIEIAPSRADAAAIISFAEGLHAANGMVLCHCGAGISRAPAAALICLAVWAGPGSEIACVEQLLCQRPAARPHAGLIQFADELLHRHGRLVAALADCTR